MFNLFDFFWGEGGGEWKVNKLSKIQIERLCKKKQNKNYTERHAIMLN